MLSKTSLAAFSDELRRIQVADADTPPDYLETRAAVMVKLGFLGPLSPGKHLVGMGQKVLGSRAGQFLSRHSEPISHGLDVAGLGVLATPSVMELKQKNTTPHERFKAKAELTGLGMLAVPSATSLARHALVRH